MFAQHFDTCNC